MKGKVNKWVDKCIHLLLKIACDKAYLSLLNLRKERYHTELLVLGRDTRQAWKCLATDLVEESGNDCWKVISSINPLICYKDN